MAIKAELHSQLKDFGYELGPFTSKDTLSSIRLLHSLVLAEKNINIAKLSDLELRERLLELGVPVGPIINHTRSIYQRKLLEKLTNQSLESQDDEFETNEYNSLYPTISQKKPTTSIEIRQSNDFDRAEPLTIRHDYKRVTTSSKKNIVEESNEIRPRIQTKSDPIKKDISFENKDAQLKVEKKGMGTFGFITITIIVALIVFFAYLWFEK